MLSQRPDAVETKFHRDGAVRRFPGVSIVAELRPDVPQHALLLEVQERARGASFGPKMSVLPPASFHMTVFDLLCAEVRRPENWSSELPLNAPLDEIDRWTKTRVDAVGDWPGPSRMGFAEIGPLGVSLHVILDPADEVVVSTLAGFREAVSLATAIRHPNHDSYRFHISLAYRIAAFDERETADFEAFRAANSRLLARSFGTLTLPQPELTYFDDMFSFPTERGVGS